MPRSPKRCRWLCTVCSRYNNPECEVCESPTCQLSKRVVGITVSSPKATRTGPRLKHKALNDAASLPIAPHAATRRARPAQEPKVVLKMKGVKRTHGETSSSKQGKRGRWSSDEDDEAKAPPSPKGAGARSAHRGQYHCKRCGLPKKNHTCLADSITAGSDEGDYDDDASDDRHTVLVDVTNWRYRDLESSVKPAAGPSSFAYVKRLDANALPVRLQPVKLDEDTPETPRAMPATTEQRRGTLRQRIQPAAPTLVPVTLRKTTPSDPTWRAYWGIVAEVLPNVPTKRLMGDAQAFSLVLVESRGGKKHVVGGTTFRLLQQEEGGKTRLVLDILLLAISASVQGRGHGSSTVLALKKLALEHAIAHGQQEAQLLTQADNLAITFWSRHGCAPAPWLPPRCTPLPHTPTSFLHTPHSPALAIGLVLNRVHRRVCVQARRLARGAHPGAPARGLEREGEPDLLWLDADGDAHLPPPQRPAVARDPAPWARLTRAPDGRVQPACCRRMLRLRSTLLCVFARWLRPLFRVCLCEEWYCARELCVCSSAIWGFGMMEMIRDSKRAKKTLGSRPVAVAV